MPRQEPEKQKHGGKKMLTEVDAILQIQFPSPGPRPEREGETPRPSAKAARRET